MAGEEVKVFQGQKVTQVNLAHLVQLVSQALMVQKVSGEIQANKEFLVSLERMVSQDHQEKEAPLEQMAHRVLQVSQVSSAWLDPLEKPDLQLVCVLAAAWIIQRGAPPHIWY